MPEAGLADTAAAETAAEAAGWSGFRGCRLALFGEGDHAVDSAFRALAGEVSEVATPAAAFTAAKPVATKASLSNVLIGVIVTVWLEESALGSSSSGFPVDVDKLPATSVVVVVGNGRATPAEEEVGVMAASSGDEASLSAWKGLVEVANGARTCACGAYGRLNLPIISGSCIMESRTGDEQCTKSSGDSSEGKTGRVNSCDTGSGSGCSERQQSGRPQSQQNG